MKKIKSIFIVMIFFLSVDLLVAGSKEDEAAERTFTQAHPWYGEIRKVREEEREPLYWIHIDPPVGPFCPMFADLPPLAPQDGMMFAAERYVKSGSTEAQKQQSLAWLTEGVKVNLSVAGAAKVLLSNVQSADTKYYRLELLIELNLSQQDKIKSVPELLNFVERPSSSYPNFCLHVKILRYLSEACLSPGAKEFVSETYRRAFMRSYDDCDVDGGWENALFSLLDDLYRFDPNKTLAGLKSYLSTQLQDRQLGRSGVKFLFKLKKWSEPSFEEQVIAFRKKYEREHLQRLFDNYGDCWRRYLLPCEAPDT